VQARNSFDVSVVIALFNKADYIRTAVESVMSQSHPAREIIIVDDGSTDGGPERICDLVHNRVRIISQDNAGPSAARNRGVAEAHCPWVAFLDADDVWLKNHLTTLAEAAKSFPGAAVVGSNYARATEPFSESLTSEPRLEDFFTTPPPGSFCASSVAVRHSAFQASGGFGDFWPGEDVELWARLALDHEVAISPKITALYRQRTGGLMDQSTGRFGNKVEMQPIFNTLNSALADQRHAPRHRAIARYRDQWLALFARQALVAGRPEVASAYLGEMERGSREAGAIMPMLARLPAPLLRAAMRVRSALRSAQK
jgi:glycosyltransferase involved in cell wall biosynthesis